MRRRNGPEQDGNQVHDRSDTEKHGEMDADLPKNLKDLVLMFALPARREVVDPVLPCAPCARGNSLSNAKVTHLRRITHREMSVQTRYRRHSASRRTPALFYRKVIVLGLISP